jgi:hypothetical protein
MVVKRPVIVAVAVISLAIALLAYLRDPPWLATYASGLRPWQQDAAGGPRYRWSGGHASFFVPSAAEAVVIPVSTEFGRGDSPMVVTFFVDDRPSAQVTLVDEGWQMVTLRLPRKGSRRVRRIDVRTNVTRDDNHGVRVGEVTTR